jgi:uncharacterized protein
MGRRGFLAGTALGIGAGLSTSAVVSAANKDETSDIALRGKNLPFIGVEETFSTRELMILNDGTRFLDHPSFEPLLTRAEALDKPL